MKHTVLLGGSGFVGSALANRLAGTGHRVTILCRNPATRRSALAGVSTRIANPGNVEGLAQALEDADTVVNLVGILNERGFDGSGFARAHVGVTENALAACEAAGVKRYIQMSALKAGEGTSHYLKSKGEAEQRVKDSALDWAIFRPSVIFGPDDSFLNRFAGLLALTPGFIPLACAGSRFQPVYVGDVAEAFANVIDSGTGQGRVLELAGPTVYTLKQLVQYVAELTGRRTAVIGLPNWISAIQGRVMDFVPGKPFSTDNYRSALLDSITDHNALPELGIVPTPLEAIAPTYLGDGQRSRRYDSARKRAGRQ